MNPLRSAERYDRLLQHLDELGRRSAPRRCELDFVDGKADRSVIALREGRNDEVFAVSEVVVHNRFGESSNLSDSVNTDSIFAFGFDDRYRSLEETLTRVSHSCHRQ